MPESNSILWHKTIILSGGINMAATFSWAQYTGSNAASSTPSTYSLTPTSSSNSMSWDFETLDGPGTASYTANPVSAGSNSYPVWLKGYWTNGVGYTISAVKFWQFNPAASSANTASFTIFATSNTQYSMASGTPTGAAYASNVSLVPHTASTASPTNALTNMTATFGGAANSYVMPTFLCLQLSANAAAPAGTSGYFGFTLQYDEM